MDPRDRADALLARARARGSFVVTPDDAVSPMDATSTIQIPRAVVDAADTAEDDEHGDTQVIPGDVARGGAPQQPPYQPQHHQQQHHQHQPQHHQQYGQQQPMRPQYPGENYQQQYYEQQPQPPEQQQQPQPREVGGLVPTVQQPGNHRSLLSRRLDGTD